ncbi:hypothetical protein KCV06_g262, partial [Aureobasidium melanogenum]
MLDCYTGTLLTVTALSSSNNTQRHPESTSPHHALSKDTNTKALLQRPATKARSFNENPPSKQAVLGREVSESEKMREGERKVRGARRCERRLGVNGWIPLKPQSRKAGGKDNDVPSKAQYELTIGCMLSDR